MGGRETVNNSQLVSALFAILFAAVMLVAGQQFIEYKSNQVSRPSIEVKAVDLAIR